MTDPWSVGMTFGRVAAYAAGAAVLLTGITMAVAADGFYGPGSLGRALIVALACAIAIIVSGPGVRRPNRFHVLAYAVFVASVGAATFLVHDRSIWCGPSHFGPCDPGVDGRGGLRLAIAGMGASAGVIFTAIGGMRSRRSSRR